MAKNGSLEPADARPPKYTKSQAATLRPIVPLLADGKWRTCGEIAKATSLAEPKVLAALRAAKKRGHAMNRPATQQRDQTWNIGPAREALEAALAEASASSDDGNSPTLRQESEPPLRTLIEDFYRAELRAKFKKQYSRDYVDGLDYTVRMIERFRPASCVGDIDGDWLAAFDVYLREAGATDVSRKKRLSYTKRIVREKFPYRSLSGNTTWRLFEPVLRAEPRGYLGSYYVKVYEPRRVASEVTKRNNRNFVKLFLRWCGSPIRLDSIDNALLDRFQKHQTNKGNRTKTAQYRCRTIRQIVNHWQPGRLPNLRNPPAPSTREGTVEHFVEYVYIPQREQKGAKKKEVQKIRRVIRDLHTFHGRDGLHFGDFTPELCEGFMRWCLTDREGGCYHDATVNKSVRFTLVNLSMAAAAKGLMPRRLFLERVGPRTPRPNSSTKRRAKASANGHAKALASSSVTSPLPSIEWSPYEPPSHWEKVFPGKSWKTIRRYVAAGKLRAEQLHKQAWRFALSDLPTLPKPR